MSMKNEIDESKLVDYPSDSMMGKLIKATHEEGLVQFLSNMCQAVGCTKFSEWIVPYDILGKKNVGVHLCKRHSNTKKPFEIRIPKTEQQTRSEIKVMGKRTIVYPMD